MLERCQSIEETQALMRDLLKHTDECKEFYAAKRTQEQAPPIIKKAGHAVVLAKSSGYYHYHLGDYTEFRLVICGLHDRGRPLAFLTDAEREAIGSKISDGLRRYHASKHLHIVP